MKIEKIENSSAILSQSEFNYITKSGDYLEVKKYANKPHANVINVSKSQYAYIDKDTGEIEIRDKQLSSSRIESIKSLKATFHNLRNLIQANVLDNSKVHWITLTYNQDNGIMDDTVKLYKDIDLFFKKFRYWLKKNKNINHIEYITTIEPQGCGAWHAHIIVIYDVKRPFIPNDIIATIWSNGFTSIKALKDTDNIANYLCSYLTDLKVDKVKKKGERLYIYPRGIRIYRHSRGVKMPEHFITSKKDYENIKKDYVLEYENAFQVLDNDNCPVRMIKKEFYKKPH